MLDELLVFGPVVKDSYHFQIIPLYLCIMGNNYTLPSQGTTYRFSIHKGHHRFDQTRHPIQAHFTSHNGVPVMPVSACKLNFYIPNYLKLKRHDFIFKMTQRQCNQDFSIGEYYIDASYFIQQFKEKGVKRHEIKTFFSMDYELEFEIYVEQSRMALEQLVKEAEGQRMSKKPSPSDFKSSNEHQKSLDAIKILSSESENDNVNDLNVEAFPKSEKRIPQQAVPPKKKERQLFRTFSKDADLSPSKTSEEGSKISKVPAIQTKFKQLAKIDTPHSIKMTESERLSDLTFSSLTEEEEAQGIKKNVVFMWMYVLAGIVVMYLSMHPVKKV